MSTLGRAGLAAGLLTGLIAFGFWAGEGEESVPSSREELTLRLQEVFLTLEAPGGIVGCFDERGSPLYIELFENKKQVDAPMRREDSFRIGSLSKLFLGYTVLRMADEGLLQLDQPASTFSPDLPEGEKITVRMLGRHTSGLPEPIRNRVLQDLVMESPDKDWSIAELLRFATSLPRVARPGAEYSYSNANGLVLAQALESVTSRSYREMIQTEVLDRWGLQRTGFAPGALPEPYGKSFRFGKKDRIISYGNVFYDVTHYGGGWASAAGEMFSTIDDLALVLPRLTTGDGLGNDVQAELRDWQPTGQRGLEYSFMMERIGEWIGHSGNVPGYDVAAHYHPALRVSVIAVTNLSNCQDQRIPAEELAKRLRKYVERNPFR